MEEPNTTAPSESRSHYWRRVLRPLFWWLLLVLVLYGIRLHQRWMAQTYLSFRVTVAGKPNPYAGERIQLDGQEYRSHQLVSLGRHQLTVTNPKTEPYATNLFVWYGARDLGEISLPRSKGVFHIKCDPRALRLSIQGPEFSTVLTNATDFSETLPTDTYRVNATYAHWEDRADVMVTANVTTTREINPSFGALEITGNKSGTTYELFRNVNDYAMQSGTLPAAITELPAGYYVLKTVFHGHEKSDSVAVKFGITNQIKIDYVFATAILETKPDGAAVSDSGGRYFGQTPLTLAELQPGRWTFQLKLPGYEPVTTTMEIAANETQTFRTNLISQGYTGAMRSARAAMQAADYERTLSAVKDALLAKPEDADALALHHQATIKLVLRNASALAKTGNYIEAGELLKNARDLLADNPEAATMQAEYKKHELEQREQARLERLTRGKVLFDSVVAKTADADLFQSYEVKSSKPFKDIERAIRSVLQTEPPPFTVGTISSAEPETFILRASQDLGNVITTTGRRVCIVVGGQIKDDETKIYFKVLEYKAKHAVTMPGILAFRDDISFVAIHPSRIPDMDDKLKAQVAEGVSNVTARIQVAIGQ